VTSVATLALGCHSIKSVPPLGTPSTATAVKHELEQHYSDTIDHGHLYPNLDQLVEMGLIEKGQLDKRTNSYTLTQRGYREIEARREWENQYLDSDAEA
jgi:PadR family transcriptional regulator PadR